MNAVNRVVLVILLLVVMVLCSVLLVEPVLVLDAVARQADALVDWLDSLPLYARLLSGILLALVLDLVLALLIFLEVRRPRRKPIRLEQAAGGEVLIGVASIADRLRYEVDQLPGILRVKPRVWGKRRGVVVELDVETAAGIDVPEQADQIVGLARRVVEENMGLKLARPPRVNLRAVPYPRPRKVVAPPRLEEPPVEPEGEPVVLPEEPEETLALPEEPEETLALPEDSEEKPALPEDSGATL